MGNDTLRVGDRAVLLAEMEARYIAHRDALNAHADSDATQAEHAAYRLGLSAIHDIPALLTEVRRLRAVERAAQAVVDCEAGDARARLLARLALILAARRGAAGGQDG